MPNVITPGTPEARQTDEAANDEVATTSEEADDDAADGGDESDDEPVTFKSKSDFAAHVNTIVTQRLKRAEKKYAPIVAERDTLKKRVEELAPVEQGKNQADQQIKALSDQVSELLNFQATAQRNELVRSIAKEHGLPDEFIPRVQGDDDDSIAEDVQQLVSLLKIDGTNPPPAPRKTSKTIKPAGQDGKGGKGTGGQGGSEDDAKNDPAKIAAEVGRYGHRPIFIK